MTTFRDILGKNKCYVLYFEYNYLSRTLDRVECNCNLYNEIRPNALLDADSFCLVHDHGYQIWEVYADRDEAVVRMEDAVKESLEMGGCSVAAIRTMVQAKWRKWLI